MPPSRSAAATPARPAPPPHPLARFTRQWYLTAFCLAVAGLLGLSGAWWVSAGALAGAAGCVWLAYIGGRDLPHAQRYYLAWLAYTRGDLDEVERVLDAIPASALRRTAVGGAVFQLRAAIALHRGEPEEAARFATLAVERRPGRVAGIYEDAWRANAFALRGLARAALGRDEEARADAAAAEALPGAQVTAFARAVLVRAVLLARKRDYAGLATELAAGKEALDALTPRERRLARALREMARIAPKSAYREAARPDEADGSRPAADWIAKVAPGAEAYARENVLAVGAPPSPLPPVAEAAVAARRMHPAKGRSPLAWIGMSLCLIALFLYVWARLTPPDAPPSPSPPVPEEPSDFTLYVLGPTFLGLIALMFVMTALRIRRQVAVVTELRAAERDAFLGRTSASAKLEELARSRLATVAGHAHLIIGEMAWRRGDWGAAIAWANQGIARVSQSPAGRAASADLLLPGLVAVRARALAASGDRAGAIGDLALLGSDFPIYPLGAYATFAVRLAGAVRAGDLDEAAKVAALRTPDMPLWAREDLLADVVLASHVGVPAEERERIEGELREDDGVRGWIDAIAPELRPKLHAVSAG